MLSIIQVGHVEASDRYIRNKMKAIENAGMKAELINLPEDCTTVDIIKAITRADYKEDNVAIMVQLPLPERVDQDEVMAHIPLDKDIDGLNPWSVYYPLTPCAIMRHFRELEHPMDFNGKKVTILGRSELVGLPLAKMMIKAGATVTVCNSHTQHWHKKALCNLSDIIVTATGKVNTIIPEDIYGTNQIIIDVGINRNAAGKLCGDVSQAARLKIAENGGYCSPVPGGVGKWTVQELVLRLKEMEDNH